VFKFNSKNVATKLSKKDLSQINKEHAQLLWRVILRHPQFDKVLIKKVSKEVVTRTFINNPDRFLLSQPFVLSTNLNEVFKFHASNLPALQTFTTEVAVHYGRELSYIEGQRERVAFDIIFQTLDLVKLNKTPVEIRAVLEHIGENDSGSEITAADRILFVKYSGAYSKMSHTVETLLSKYKHVGFINKNRDEIITKIASLCPEVTLTALDSMFRRLLAQMMLDVTTDGCGVLLEKFIADYGFGPEQLKRIMKFIPEEAPLNKFYQHYVRAIQTLRHVRTKDVNPFESDPVLLRLLLNYYNTQVNLMAARIPA
jgi:hypothetical protein